MNQKQIFGLFFGIGCWVLAQMPVALADAQTAQRLTVLNHVTDYVATVGRDPQTKKEILQERRDLRRDSRLKAEARKKREKMRQQMKVQEQLIMRKIQAHGR